MALKRVLGDGAVCDCGGSCELCEATEATVSKAEDRSETKTAKAAEKQKEN